MKQRRRAWHHNEIRGPKTEFRKKSEFRIPNGSRSGTSGFGVRISFEFRSSNFGICRMSDIFFYILAFLTLVFGFLVIANPFSRNPVTSAMFLVLTLGSLAGLFVLLHAFFLAAVQVLVYAGAVMVLFLFVIMLLDLRAEERRRIKVAGVVGGLISVGAILAIFLSALAQVAPLT